MFCTDSQSLKIHKSGEGFRNEKFKIHFRVVAVLSIWKGESKTGPIFDSQNGTLDLPLKAKS